MTLGNILREQAIASLRHEYSKGLQDGILLAIDHLQGKQAGGVPYDGPMPDELKQWADGVRAALTEART